MAKLKKLDSVFAKDDPTALAKPPLPTVPAENPPGTAKTAPRSVRKPKADTNPAPQPPDAPEEVLDMTPVQINVVVPAYVRTRINRMNADRKSPGLTIRAIAREATVKAVNELWEGKGGNA